jgi:hypothetical protein
MGPRFENALYRADALALLERLPTDHVDLVYLDPPLAPGSSVSGGDLPDQAKHFIWIGQVFEQCQRVLTANGTLVLQLPARAPAGYRMLLDWLFGSGRLHEEIVWVYERSHTKRPRRGHDILLFYGNDAATRKDANLELRPLKAVSTGTVWDDIARPAHTRNIPLAGQKPLALLERIIQIECPSNGLVLDPFMGAGTTLIAAARLGRRWLGCDILTSAFGAALHELGMMVNGADLFVSDEDALESAPVLRVAEAAPVQRLVDLAMSRQIVVPTTTFAYQAAVPEEEDRTTEFKTITGGNPAASIATNAEKYAVGFLNSEGGNIYWGIRDDRTVVGVALTATQRDEVRVGVNNRLSSIRPPILPDAFRLNFYRVLGAPEPSERSVVELRVPSLPQRGFLFHTGSEAVYMRLDGVSQKLSMVQVQEWIRRSERAQQVLDRAA